MDFCLPWLWKICLYKTTLWKMKAYRHDSAQQLNLIVQYFIILQFLSFLPYFFSIFLFGSDWSCRNFDGGFGAVPGAESHAGQIFCCVGALSIGNALHYVDEDLLGWWLSERQCDSGGLNGRPEKQADVCYSWWILSSLSILGRVRFCIIFDFILDWQSFFAKGKRPVIAQNSIIFILFMFVVGILDFWREISRIHYRLSRCWWWWNCGQTL